MPDILQKGPCAAYVCMQRLRTIVAMDYLRDAEGLSSAYSIDIKFGRGVRRSVGGTTTSGLARRHLLGEIELGKKAVAALRVISPGAGRLYDEQFWSIIDRAGNFAGNWLLQGELLDRTRRVRSESTHIHEFLAQFFGFPLGKVLAHLCWTGPQIRDMNPETRRGLLQWMIDHPGLESTLILCTDRFSAFPRPDGTVGHVAELIPLSLVIAATCGGLTFSAPLLFALLRKVLLDDFDHGGARMALERYSFFGALEAVARYQVNRAAHLDPDIVLPAWTTEALGNRCWCDGESPSAYLRSADRSIHPNFVSCLSEALGPLM